MKYFNIKSIFLGIGIGVILTAMSGMIYFNFANSKATMTKEEIINEAKKFGMIEASSVISQTVMPVATINPTPTLTPHPTSPPPTQTPTLGPEVIITVQEGDTAVIVAKKLYDGKLIDDQDSFVKMMIDSKAAYKVFAKQYHFRLGMGTQDIINSLTTR